MSCGLQGLHNELLHFGHIFLLQVLGSPAGRFFVGKYGKMVVSVVVITPKWMVYKGTIPSIDDD